MADKKIEKALYGPSLTEVALGAVLGFIVGIVAACAYLVFKPVQQVLVMPEKAKQSISVVYYLPGSESNAKNRGWQAKQKQFLAGAGVQLSEDELNAWAAKLGTPPPPLPGKTPAPGAPAKAPVASAPAPQGIFIPGPPNFRLVDGKLQIGLKCILNWYGVTHEVIVLATGGVTKSGDQFMFTPETVYLGSCPLHLLPSVAAPFVAHIIDREKIPDDIRAAWAKLTNVTIDGNALKLAVQ